MTEDVISEKVATKQVDEFFDWYDIDLSRKTDMQREPMEMNRADLINYVMKGRLEFKVEDDEMIVDQYLKRPRGENKEITSIRYREIRGKDKKAGKKLDPTDMDGRAFALLGSLSGLGDRVIADLRGADYSVASTLGVTFLLL